MNLQFIHDSKGNTTGVFITIDEWETLKAKYTGLQKEETNSMTELAVWQKQIVEERLSDYYKTPNDVTDFDKTIDDVENSL